MSETRVYVMIEFSYESGGICNLAYIGAAVLNFGLAWLSSPNINKIEKHGANVG